MAQNKTGMDPNPDGTWTAYIGDTKFTGTRDQCTDWISGPLTIDETKPTWFHPDPDHPSNRADPCQPPFP